MKKTLITLAILSLATTSFAAKIVPLQILDAPAAPVAVKASALITESKPIATPVAPLDALPLQPAPVKQPIASAPEVLAPFIPAPIQPKAKSQAKKAPALDQARLEASQRWEQTGAAEALVGQGGAVEYPYGHSRPTITCSPLHVCTISLQDGESVTSVSVGDTVSWLLQTVVAGNKPVLIIKPVQAGLSTNLVATTDKGRIYYMHLISSKTEYTPMVSWYDPAAMTRDLRIEADAAARQKAEFEASIAATKMAAAQAQSQRVVADKSVGKLDPTSLDFGYACEGDATFKPSRVFANDTHTFIQLPPGSSAADAPAVFNVTNNETELLNSRLVNGYYIVDGKPAKLQLVLGVGDAAQKVSCFKQAKNTGFFGWGAK